MAMAGLLQGCVPKGSDKAASLIADTSTAQPPLATYDCGSDGRLTIENHTTSVHVTEPDGTMVDMPASPPTQHSRFGEAPYALVVEGQEALLMKNGKEPITCRR
jgi:hypothetical protein